MEGVVFILVLAVIWACVEILRSKRIFREEHAALMNRVWTLEKALTLVQKAPAPPPAPAPVVATRVANRTPAPPPIPSNIPCPRQSCTWPRRRPSRYSQPLQLLLTRQFRRPSLRRHPCPHACIRRLHSPPPRPSWNLPSSSVSAEVPKIGKPWLAAISSTSSAHSCW